MLRKINRETYNKDMKRFELVCGKKDDAPLCPYGNRYKWIGFDHHELSFVRFTKSVFKEMIKNKNLEEIE